MTSLKELKQLVTQFRDERDWKQFHTPKDLALSISLESAELLEHFQWVSEKESFKKIVSDKNEIADEMADVLAYLLALSDIANIDLSDVLVRKLEKNEVKYPVEKSKGSAKKYTELEN